MSDTKDKIADWVADYFEGTRSMNAEKWASRFAEDAIFHDPVGTEKAIGKAQILERGKGFVNAFKEVGLHETYVHCHNQTAVAKWEGRAIDQDGKTINFEGINVFHFSQEGLITSLEGFWDPSTMA